MPAYIDYGEGTPGGEAGVAHTGVGSIRQEWSGVLRK